MRMSFALTSPFKPTGDQPQAIEKLVAGIRAGARHQTLLGVTGSGKTFVMSNVIAQIKKPTLIISHNKTLAAQLASEFEEFFPDAAVHYFVSYYDYYQPEAYVPSSDTYIEKETNINEEIDRLRHAATQALLTRKDVILVASVSCIYGLGSPEEYQAISLKLNVRANGRSPVRTDILRSLVRMQYERNDIDLHRGTFRVRGNSIDVFPVFSLEQIWRLECAGNSLVKISEVDSLTGKSLRTTEEITIFPATHYVAPAHEVEDILKQIERDLDGAVNTFLAAGKPLEAERLSQRVRFDLEMIRATGYCNGIENYSRYFDRRKAGEPPHTLIDFFKYSDPNSLTFIDESHMTIPQIRGMYEGDKSRKDTLVSYGFRLPAARDNRPLTFDEFNKRIGQVTYVSATHGEYELLQSRSHPTHPRPSGDPSQEGNSQKSPPAEGRRCAGVGYDGIVEQLIRPPGLRDPPIEIQPLQNQIDHLLGEIQKRIAKKQRVLVTTLTKRMAEDLAEYLEEINVKAAYIHADVETFERLELLRDLRLGVYDVLVGINLLREGLDLPEVSLVAILDADKEGFLRSDTSLLQVMGRAARHAEGHIIMYADRVTGSMQSAIDEVKRRRKIQESYNKKHGVTPQSITKEIREHRLAGGKLAPEEKKTEVDYAKMDKKEVRYYLEELKDRMDLASKNLEFERAGEFRDEIVTINQSLRRKKHKV